MEQQPIYLAGKVNGEKNKIVKGIPRTFVCSDGGNHSEHEWGYSYWTFNDSTLRQCVMDYAITEIQKCDFLLAYLYTTDSYGSIAEIAYASALGKRCYLIILAEADPSETFQPKHGDESSYDISSLHDSYWFISHFPKVCTYVVSSQERAAILARKICALESPIEHIFFEYLPNDLIEQVSLQLPIGKYRADFAFPDHKFVVELDGHDYHKTKEQRGYDAQRDRFISREGWQVLRFTGSEIWRDPASCIKEVCQMCQEPS
jgi:very-short-patch-repair endonuclease